MAHSITTSRCFYRLLPTLHTEGPDVTRVDGAGTVSTVLVSIVFVCVVVCVVAVTETECTGLRAQQLHIPRCMSRRPSTGQPIGIPSVHWRSLLVRNALRR